jgi:hypothetical protein
MPKACLTGNSGGLIAPPKNGQWYGGAPLNSIYDANGVEYMADNFTDYTKPKDDPDRFRFGVFRLEANGTLTRLPLEDDKDHIAGRGFAYVDDSDGEGRYSASHNGVPYDRLIPGFAPITDRAALQPR